MSSRPTNATVATKLAGPYCGRLAQCSTAIFNQLYPAGTTECVADYQDRVVAPTESNDCTMAEVDRCERALVGAPCDDYLRDELPDDCVRCDPND